MEENTQQAAPILITAWTRHAQLDEMSSKRSKAHLRLRRWIAAMGILATLFAILTQTYPDSFPKIGGLTLKFLLILAPILGSGLAAYTSKMYASGDWLTQRAGAEEIKKEIYMYRTILQKQPNRKAYLEKRLVEIQRQIFRSLGGELILKNYEGQLPPHYNPEDPASDYGFNDLMGDDYINFRVGHQLDWHVRKNNQYEKERTRLTLYIYIAGGLGALFAALGEPGSSISLWVALTAAFTAAFLGWQELRSIDTIIRNYSKVIMELTIIYDHWNNLEGNEKNEKEFYRMVKSTEEILWAQNMEYIKSMQEALAEDDSLEKESGLINRTIKEAVDSNERFKKNIEDATVEFVKETLEETEEQLTETYKAALGTLAEEASSPLVQEELAAMAKAASEGVHNILERISEFNSSLQNIAKEFDGVDIGPNTPPSVLNDLLSRYPKSKEAKG